VTQKVGGRGQFDVVADGDVIASRQNRVRLRDGWPDPEAVTRALRERLG
jgi:hypothetical protein